VLQRSLQALRYVGWAEGSSFLILLGIAMPLKYAFDLPQAVFVVGVAHGFLFSLYLLSIAWVTLVHRWSFGRVLAAFIAAFIPFGPFVFDRWIRH
jgi:integral membrane protein